MSDPSPWIVRNATAMPRVQMNHLVSTIPTQDVATFLERRFALSRHIRLSCYLVTDQQAIQWLATPRVRMLADFSGGKLHAIGKNNDSTGTSWFSLTKAVRAVTSVPGAHLKMFVFDDRSVLLGSANLCPKSLREHVELDWYGEDSAVVTRAVRLWKHIAKHGSVRRTLEGNHVVAHSLVPSSPEWHADHSLPTTRTPSLRTNTWSNGTPEEEIRSTWIRALDAATRQFDGFGMYIYWEPDSDFERALFSARRRGVSVRLAVRSFPGLPASYRPAVEAYQRATEVGVEVRGRLNLHAKGFVTTQYGCVASWNPEFVASPRQGHEAGIVFQESNTAHPELREWFEHLWESCEHQFR